MADRAQQIIDEGDPMKILGMAMRAKAAADRGEYCECEEPSLTGYDLMCGDCLRENQGQIERREAAMRAPHEFVPLGNGRLNGRMCKFCSGWKDDPRHASTQEESR